MTSPFLVWSVRLLGILGLVFVVGVSVVDVAEGHWWLAIVRIGVVGAIAYGLHRSSSRAGPE